MPRGGTSAQGRGGKAASDPASDPTKRKRDASDAGNLDGIQKRRSTAKSKEEGLEWQRQYYQGVSISELAGMGCGWHLLGTPPLPFQAPFTCDGKMEIMAGTEGDGSGGIRLCGPKDYWGISDDGVHDAVFLIPFKHIEQVVILPIPGKPTRSNDMAYQVIIIPTGATGASSVKRKYPEIISFSWPGKTVDEELKGTVGEAANSANDTYLSILKKVLNDQLEAFKKAVIDVTDKPSTSLMVGKASTLSPPMGSNVKSKVDGHVYFLDTGILFTSELLRIYLPFRSLSVVMLVQARDMKGANGANGKIAAINMICRCTEPFYKAKGDGSGEETLINFGRLDAALFESVQGYMKRYSIQVMLCEQRFYDFDKNEPMTGFMPLSMG